MTGKTIKDGRGTAEHTHIKTIIRKMEYIYFTGVIMLSQDLVCSVFLLNYSFIIQLFIAIIYRYMSEEEDRLKHMHELATQSRSRAYCPYSKFAVGVCVLGFNGKYYTGCNVEKAVCSLCAEQTAIAKMVEDGCRRIQEVYVVTELSGEQLAAPCGYCRQYIKEFSHDDQRLMVHLGSTSKGYEKSFTFSYLFPVSFGPTSLGFPLP